MIKVGFPMGSEKTLHISFRSRYFFLCSKDELRSRLSHKMIMTRSNGRAEDPCSPERILASPVPHGSQAATIGNKPWSRGGDP